MPIPILMFLKPKHVYIWVLVIGISFLIAPILCVIPGMQCSGDPIGFLILGLVIIILGIALKFYQSHNKSINTEKLI